MQFRRDGFSCSRLAPYTAWEDVSEKTVGFWKLYLEAAEPIEVTRLAVRTINRIALLEGVFELGSYLTAPPAIPPGLPNRLLSFLSQNMVQDEETGIMANVIKPSRLQTRAESGPSFWTATYSLNGSSGRQTSDCWKTSILCGD